MKTLIQKKHDLIAKALKYHHKKIRSKISNEFILFMLGNELNTEKDIKTFSVKKGSENIVKNALNFIDGGEKNSQKTQLKDCYNSSYGILDLDLILTDDRFNDIHYEIFNDLGELCGKLN